MKRGLEKLYRRVEKEVSEEMLQVSPPSPPSHPHTVTPSQVVWGHMQEAFMEQCRKFQTLIKQCYHDGSVNLEFTLADLADYFASISAQR